VGAVGPLIAHFDSPDRLAVGGAMIDRRTWDSHAITTPAALEDWRGRPPQAVDWLAGSAILHRASAARQTGPFHADYFFYYDEPDYCLRMARQGWRIECVPAAVGWESPGAVPPYLQTRNRLEFLKRLAPRRVLAREFARIGFHVARDALRPTARAEIPARLRGVRDFARGRWGPEPKP
jgi:GT2 family glycosyltransferase